jgi:hypothetical protein
MKALIMVFISNHYNNFKSLKITNESDPNAFQMGKKIVLVSKPGELLKIQNTLHKYWGGGRLSGFGLGKSWQPYLIL